MEQFDSRLMPGGGFSEVLDNLVAVLVTIGPTSRALCGDYLSDGFLTGSSLVIGK